MAPKHTNGHSDDRPLDVLVLMGGPSLERDVSLVSGRAVAASLRRLGHIVRNHDVTEDISSLLRALSPRPDCVFNALHGKFGEDGTIQAMLNTLRVPYTHSGMTASAVAMDKPLAIRVFRSSGIDCPSSFVAHREEIVSQKRQPPPYVIKPLNDGSSVGVRIVRDRAEHNALDLSDWPFGDYAMVEQFISGKELTVAVMGDTPLAVTEISTDREFYDYDAKYVPGGSSHQIPAQIPARAYERAMESALLAHEALGCRGVSRADLRFDGKKVYMLEVNTQPGMTPTSLVPEQAAHRGMSFDKLVSWMVSRAEYDT